MCSDPVCIVDVTKTRMTWTWTMFFFFKNNAKVAMAECCFLQTSQKIKSAMSIHPSIIYYHPSFAGSRKGLELTPADRGREAGYTQVPCLNMKKCTNKNKVLLS